MHLPSHYACARFTSLLSQGSSLYPRPRGQLYKVFLPVEQIEPQLHGRHNVWWSLGCSHTRGELPFPNALEFRHVCFGQCNMSGSGPPSR